MNVIPELTSENAVISVNGHFFDLREIARTELAPDALTVTFKNDDRIVLKWRDPLERRQMLDTLRIRDN